MKGKATKRAEAVERQTKHDELNTMSKLGKIGQRPGASERERARILAAFGAEHGAGTPEGE